MAEVTVIDRLEVNDPTVEVVLIKVADQETYTSKKFGSIRAAQLTPYRAATADTYWFDFSGCSGTVHSARGTISVAGTVSYGVGTAKIFTLTLYGRM
jgi:hypothetical protein